MKTKPLQQFFHMAVFVLYVVLTFEPVAVADPGEGPWGPELPPYFLTKMMPEGPKKKIVQTGPPLSQDLDDPSPPPSEGLDLPLTVDETSPAALLHSSRFVCSSKW